MVAVVAVVVVVVVSAAVVEVERTPVAPRLVVVVSVAIPPVLEAVLPNAVDVAVLDAEVTLDVGEEVLGLFVAVGVAGADWDPEFEVEGAVVGTEDDTFDPELENVDWDDGGVGEERVDDTKSEVGD